jgi:hypothetical protein
MDYRWRQKSGAVISIAEPIPVVSKMERNCQHCSFSHEHEAETQKAQPILTGG